MTFRGGFPPAFPSISGYFLISQSFSQNSPASNSDPIA